MEWKKGRESDNVVEDSGSGNDSGRGVRLPFRSVNLGIKGILIVVVISFFLGLNPLEVLSFLSGSSSNLNLRSSQPSTPVTSNEPQVQFVRTILGSTEDVWGTYFRQLGRNYDEPQLELFKGHTRSACGSASESMGPFYCSGDQRVYLDLSFFEEMESQFHASGDFARAYVIAHEVGHHVQDLLGIMAKVDEGRNSGARMEGAQGLSVRLELQADCFAGVWANRSEQQLKWLQDGDVEAALNAAKQVGDDILETRSQGYAVPDSFTHGSSAQRVRWFKTGFSSGDINSCDTFRGNV